jgi:hypothetical protein
MTRWSFAVGLIIAGFALACMRATEQPDAQSSYSPSRTTRGEPDLQGVWQALNSAAWNLEDHGGATGVPAGKSVVDGGSIPYQPWALARRKENFANRRTADPEAHCDMPGVPRITYVAYPFQILQLGRYVVFNYEYLNLTRYVYMDKTPRPGADVIDFYMGASDGHWDGNTLVVDTTNNNDRTWFDRAGNFHSDALHVVERFTRTSRDHLQYEVTIEDPKVFTRPWKISMPLYRRVERDAELLEYECYAYLEEDTEPGAVK